MARIADAAHEMANKWVAILVDNGFEQVELTEPKWALEQAGAQTQIVSPQQGKVKGWNHTEWGEEFQVDVPLDQADPSLSFLLLSTCVIFSMTKSFNEFISNKRIIQWLTIL